MWPGRAHSFPFPSAAFPGLPVCWNVSRLGIVTARIFPSQGNRFQLEPGDSSHMGRGYQRGRGEMLGQPQLLRPRGPGSVPILSRRCKPVSPLGRARGNLGFWSCEAQERQWEALGTRDCLSEEGTWLAVSHRPHFLQCLRESGRGATSESNLRWGSARLASVLWPMGATQPQQEVALLSLSPTSALHSGPPVPPGPVPSQ